MVRRCEPRAEAAHARGQVGRAHEELQGRVRIRVRARARVRESLAVALALTLTLTCRSNPNPNPDLQVEAARPRHGGVERGKAVGRDEEGDLTVRVRVRVGVGVGVGVGARVRVSKVAMEKATLRRPRRSAILVSIAWLGLG